MIGFTLVPAAGAGRDDVERLRAALAGVDDGLDPIALHRSAGLAGDRGDVPQPLDLAVAAQLRPYPGRIGLAVDQEQRVAIDQVGVEILGEPHFAGR